MKFTETPLLGAFVIEMGPIEDEPGFFARIFCKKEFRAHRLNSNLVLRSGYTHSARRWSSAPASSSGRILQTRRVIVDRDPFRRHRFESLALREFFDLRLFEHRLLVRRYGND